MSKLTELDPIDRRILAILQKDATVTAQALGEMVGLSANPCWRRVKRLESCGVIQARVALIDTVSIGLGLHAFVTIRTDSHSQNWLQQFALVVHNAPEIVECHRISGDADYLLKIIVRDIEHYDRIYKKIIASVPDLNSVSSFFSMERIKFGTSIDVGTAK